MNTIEQTTSTWGADVVRGLAHPDSSAARRDRIESNQGIRQLMTDQFDAALKLLRASLRTEDQLCDLLHCAGTTLANSTTGTLDKQNVELITALVDVLQYRTSNEVEALIDCAMGITTLEVQSCE